MAFSSEVDTGSREENASKRRLRSIPRGDSKKLKYFNDTMM
jgi:hypothetical protein